MVRLRKLFLVPLHFRSHLSFDPECQLPLKCTVCSTLYFKTKPNFQIKNLFLKKYIFLFVCKKTTTKKQITYWQHFLSYFSHREMWMFLFFLSVCLPFILSTIYWLAAMSGFNHQIKDSKTYLKKKKKTWRSVYYQDGYLLPGSPRMVKYGLHESMPYDVVTQSLHNPW